MKEELRKKMGALLKLERERLDIDRDELAEQLKIAASHLEQIEKGSSEGLPSDIYFELFAKSYAEAIGIDYAATSEAMKDEINAATREVSAPTKSGTTPQKKSLAEGDEEAEEVEEEEDAGLGSLKKLGILLGAIAGLLIIFIVAYKIFWATDQPMTSTEQGAGGTNTQTATATDQQAEFANYDWNVPAYQPAAPLVLKVRAREASWATILADGDTVIFRGLGAGREYVITANYRIQVSIALPRFVETELNGQLVDLRDPDSRRISRVMIDQLTAKKFINTEPPQVQERPTQPPPSPKPQAQPKVEERPADTGPTALPSNQVIGSEPASGDSTVSENKETSLEP